MKKILVLIICILFLSGCGSNKQKYTVTFNSNGGSSVLSQTIIEGEKVKEPSSPIKNGYDFGGWLLNGQVYDFQEPVTSDMTLIAVWYVIDNNIGMD